ncbi:MAG: lysophospholipid acyltransferase family protein [bacterium]
MILYFLLKIGIFLSYIIPRKLSLFLAEIIGYLCFLICRKKRKIITENVITVLNKKNIDIKIVKNIFINYSKYYVDFLYLEWFKKRKNKISNIVNVNYLKDAIQKNKGVILVTAHLGNWDVGALNFIQSGFSMNVVVERLYPKKLYEFYRKNRQKLGVKVISSGFVNVIQEKLRNNEIVAIVVDRNVEGKGVEVEFFNKKTKMPVGPIVLALRTGAVIIPGFTIRKNDNTYLTFLLESIEIEKKKNLEQTIKYNLEKMNKVIEEQIKKYISQWYNLQPF